MNSLAQREKMLTWKIPKLLTTLSIPTILSQLITVLYNTADTYFVSKISNSASGAIGVVFSLQAIIQAIGFGFAMGTGSLISLKMGAKKNDEASMFAISGLSGSFLLGTILTIFGLIFLKPLMYLLGSTETMLSYCMDYAKYILLSAPLLCVSFVLNNILKSEGRTLLAMIGIISGAILNIALDPLFIFTLNLGISGASIATALSQIISSIILVILLLKKSELHISFKRISKNPNDYLKMMTTGIPTVFRQGMGSIATALLNNQAKVYGDAAIAAVSIVNKVYMLIRNIILGFGQAFMPVAGFNYGAGNKKRVKEAFSYTCFVGSIVCIVFAIFVFFFREQIVLFFRNDDEVINVGKIGLMFYTLSIPFLCFSTLVNQMYQCLGFKVIATILACCRQGIFYIPLILILPIYFGLNGILAVQSISDILTMLVSVPFLIYFFKVKLKEDKTKEEI